jgi:hypothetical protein
MALATVVIAVALSRQRAASSAGLCRSSSPRARLAAPDAHGLLAATTDRIVAVSRRGSACVLSTARSRRALLRHIAKRPGAGAAFVEDHVGSDRVVISEEKRTLVKPSKGEVTHPSWSSDGRLAWAVDFRMLKVWSSSSRETRTIRPPAEATAIFSPFFSPRGKLVAVVQEHVAGLVAAEDDFLDNLWSYEPSSHTWTRLTDFEARGDRWSVIRTPITTAAGTYFVRVRGAAEATREPSFELWHLSSGEVRKLRDLPREMYLAGFSEGSLAWNAPSARCADWGLFVESRGGLERIGCGAVMVDPVAEPDPDLGPIASHQDIEPRPQAPAERAKVAVVLGDFQSRQRAGDIAAKSRGLPMPIVVNHARAPLAVRPRAWAIAWKVEDAGAAASMLYRVRHSLPAFSKRIWIAPVRWGLGEAST